MTMKVNILGNSHSMIDQYLGEIRNVHIQQDPMRFRANIQRIGEIFAIEIGKTLPFQLTEITTPLGTAMVPQMDSQPVLATILRAGLPMHQGMLRIFDRAENAFISAFRKYRDDHTFEIEFEYMSSPSLDGKIVILTDPMLASGMSMEVSYLGLLSKGKPAHIHLVSVIGSKQGVAYITEKITSPNVTLWLGAVDEELNAFSYIVPGLGDAGDLAYGAKVDSR